MYFLYYAPLFKDLLTSRIISVNLQDSSPTSTSKHSPFHVANKGVGSLCYNTSFVWMDRQKTFYCLQSYVEPLPLPYEYLRWSSEKYVKLKFVKAIVKLAGLYKEDFMQQLFLGRVSCYSLQLKYIWYNNNVLSLTTKVWSSCITDISIT
jgi:hypothetical protein